MTMGNFTRLLFGVMFLGQFTFAQTEYVPMTQVRKVSDQNTLMLWGNELTCKLGNLKIRSGDDIQVLSENVWNNTSADPEYFQFTSTGGYWNVVGVRPNTSGDDWDISLYDDLTFSTVLSSSIYGGSMVDYVLLDGNHTPSDARGIKASRYSGSGSGRVEWEGGTDLITPGAPFTEAWTAGDVVEVWDVYLTPGYYKCTMLVNSGTADLGMALYGSSGSAYYAARANYLALADANGAGTGESFWINITTTDYYGLCLFANDPNSANIMVKFETPGQWLGTISNNWFTAENWSAEFIPASATDVTINTGYTYSPVITSGSASCNNITLGSGAKLSIGSANLNVAGNMTIYGQVEQTHYNADFIVAGSVYWESGSTANITDDGEFHIEGDWEFRSGSAARLENGCTYFEGVSTSYIRSYETNCAFKNVLNNKTAGYLYFSSSSTDTLKINGYYDNLSSTSLFYSNTDYPLVLKGELYNNGHIYCPYGTFIFDGTSNNIDLNTGDYFNNIIINSTGNVTLFDSLRVNGDLTINGGALVAATYPILIKGNWDNQVGTTGFSEGTGTVEFNGSDSSDILSTETFYNLNLNKTYLSYNGLVLWQDVSVTNNLHIIDGSMELNDPADLNIMGNLTIELNAGLNANDNYGPQIFIGKNWTNANTNFSTENGFDPGYYSRVTFNGTIEQYLTTACAEETFYNLVIDKSSGKFKPNDNIQCNQAILIQNGIWDDNITGLTHSVGGDFTVTSTGAFYNVTTKNTLTFLGPLNAYLTYSGASGYFHHLVINKPAGFAVTQVGNTSCQFGGNFTIDEGIYNQNGYQLSVFGDVNINDVGKLQLPAGSQLRLAHLKSLNVNSGGTCEIIGTAGNQVHIQGNVAEAMYNFNVGPGGTVAAAYVTFKQLNINGVYLQSGALVDPAHSFTGCTFQDGAAGGTLLGLNNNQDMIIRGAVFPTNTWGGNSNAAKTLDQGHVYFTNFSGGFSGEAYDADDFNRIDWIPTLTAEATAVPGSVCYGSTSQLNAVPSGGLAPFTYEWSPSASLSNAGIANPVASPLTTTTYTVTITDALGTSATGDIVVTVNTYVPVSVSITASANPSLQGAFVTFTATPANGGTTPVYQWKVNGSDVGIDLSTFSYIPVYGDQVSCVLISNAPCVTGNPATSDTIIMIVIPTNITVTGAIMAGTDTCFNAHSTITVAGGGSTFLVGSGASAIMVAGLRISYLPGTTVESNGYLHGYITMTNEYCGLVRSMVSVVSSEDEIHANPLPASRMFTIYPNPTTGIFTMLNRGNIITGQVKVSIFDIHGNMIFSTSYAGERSHLFTLPDLPPGLCFVKVITGDQIESFKLIVTQ